MNRILRTFFILPALILALVVIPTVAFSAGQSDEPDFFWNLTTFDEMESTANQTISPLPTPTSPGGTIPVPTATATRRPVVYPTATPHRHYPGRPSYPVYATATKVPTPTATPPAAFTTPNDEAYINSMRIEKVIGDRLSSTIYAYTEDGYLYRSDDDGTIWMLISTTPPVNTFVMNATNPDVLYGSNGVGCSSDIMYKSVDGGTTWIEVPGSAGKLPLLSHPADEDSLFAADCDMLYLTNDGGYSWIAKPDNSPDALWETFRVVDMAAASLIGDPTPNLPNWDQLYAGGIDSEGTGVIAFSNDLGETWVRLTPNISPAPWSMTAITADPFIEGLIAFTEPRSVWYTENFGVNWQVTTKGLNNVLDRGISGAPFGLNDIVYHDSSRKLYLATARGLYMKVPASNTWEKIDDTNFDLAEITGILFTETTPNMLWLNSEDGVFIYNID
ncbi:MAG: hypothetical protein KDE19_07210 [Caldilineaceae bacterium]|nr:hypothetical protein [Caldilineaceae bacterium]